MTDNIIAISFLVFSYLLGSIPFGYIIGLKKGIDITKKGSGNIGSTNVTRILGVKYGVMNLTLDTLKGAFVILIIYLLEIHKIWYNPITIHGESVYLLYGAFAALGHCYPCFLKLNGGKAVATSLGALLVTMPMVGAIALLIFTIMQILKGYVSLSSTTAAILSIATSFIIYGIFYDMWASCFVLMLMVFLIVIRHQKNYERLLRGEEKKLIIKK